VAHRWKALGSKQAVRIVVRVEVRDVSDIVAARFQPVSEREFPEKPFAGTGGKRRVENLTILSVGTVEADLNVRPPVPLVLAVVVERELARPAIVRLPRRVRTLENEIGRAIVADDEDEVALQSIALGGEFAEVNAARPVLRNFDPRSE